jgi:hypothetical protein
MKTNKQQTETKFDRDLDPYDETRIFPGYWDLSDMPDLPEIQEMESLAQDEDGSSQVEDHGLAPGAMDEWHLAAYFDEYLARKRRGWSAY